MKPLYISLKFSAILLIATVIVWWLFDMAGLNIPIFIPRTPIKLYGFTLFTIELTVLILAIKAIFHINGSSSILKLTLWGASVLFFSQVIFQFILSFTNEYDKLYFYFHGLIAMTLFGLMLSFVISFQLKTKKTGVIIIGFLVLAVLVAIIQQFYPNFLKA